MHVLAHRGSRTECTFGTFKSLNVKPVRLRRGSRPVDPGRIGARTSPEAGDVGLGPQSEELGSPLSRCSPVPVNPARVSPGCEPRSENEIVPVEDYRISSPPMISLRISVVPAPISSSLVPR